MTGDRHLPSLWEPAGEIPAGPPGVLDARRAACRRHSETRKAIILSYVYFRSGTSGPDHDACTTDTPATMPDSANVIYARDVVSRAVPRPDPRVGPAQWADPPPLWRIQHGNCMAAITPRPW
jgi:hypothetical protein